ncbi:diguanylate cyclase domain-containing protein [Caproiciproducens faecalis]|uniref:Diguanylate cyclase n=1 Tax=Caproiciproducens faecalis TaxID=2820301 RepID=A0ABS7DLX7_9FIRM|nr:diguanylate cyclase [Caproiciproducens faecalis]MBW7572213.1 diguanylate cyclase [Caproiciproducens faecalis]
MLNRIFEEEVQEDLRSNTRYSAEIIQTQLEKTISSVKLAAQAIGADKASLDKTSAEELLAQMKDTDSFSTLAVGLPDGTCYLAGGQTIQIGGWPCFKQAMSGKEAVAVVPGLGTDGTNSIAAAVPIRSGEKIVGTVSTIIPAKSFSEFIKTKIPGEKGNSWLIQGDGTIILSPDSQHIGDNIFSLTSPALKDASSISRIKEAMKSGQAGNFHYYTNLGEYYVSYLPVGAGDWYLFGTVSLNAVTSRSNKVLTYTVSLVVRLAILLILLAAYIILSERKNREKLRTKNDELKSTKVELETFVANLPGGAFRFSADENAEFQFVSDGLLKMLGYTREQFLSTYDHSFYNMVYEEDRLRVIDSIHHQISKENFAEVKYRIVTAQGAVRWLLNRAKIVTHENGYREFYAVVVDITESKQAHKKANDIMTQLQTLANSIPGGVAQYLYDGDLKLLYASDGFYKLTGYTKEEYALLPGEEGIRNVHSEDAQLVAILLKKQIEDNRPVTAEFRMVKKDGGVIWVSLSGTHTVNQNNQVIYQCVYTDITSLKQTQEELEVERERYQIAENLSDDIMFEYDIVTDRMDFSPLFTALTGQYPHISNFLRDIGQNRSICKDDLSQFGSLLKEFRTGNTEHEIEFRFITKMGQPVWHRVRAKIMYDSYGKPSKAVGKAYNIDSQKKEMQRLMDKSQRDPLTNLYNKTATQSQIEDHLSASNSFGVHALMMVDVDNFKAINDQFGHLAGDGVICDISAKLQKLFRTSDVVGRIGGDEFLVFLRDIATDDLIAEKAQAMCEIFHHTHAGGHLEYRISGSIGIALYPSDGTTYQELYPKADSALYKAKEQGKDRFAFYSDIPDSEK